MKKFWQFNFVFVIGLGGYRSSYENETFALESMTIIIPFMIISHSTIIEK